ncbi:hypothetical protein [Tenacibaculum aiptasiae]|uniref:hypothetical protein n=1 Tax=Tenacibaculum aiptasiae TaxID=426481 RepID=UPI00232D1463|nr:hypothetical protein [Tenacibaculum aiptasiae]
MAKKNIYWIIAGIINLLTFLIHLIGGQTTLVNPLLKSKLSLQVQTEMLGVWHMATVVLLLSSIVFFKHYYSKQVNSNKELISFISYLYIGFSIVFIGSSFFNEILAPQWILLLPLGIIGILGINNEKRKMRLS